MALEEQTPDPSIASAVESLGNDLFGAGDKEETPLGEPAGSRPSDESTPPAPPIVEDLPLPKAWKKETEALWKPLPAEVKKYLVAREADMVKGLEQYSGSHKNWTGLIEPYQPLLQQHPDVDPVKLLQNLLNNHLAIVKSSPEQKRELAKKLLQSYGIDLGETPPAQQQASALPPEVQQALGRVSSVEQNLQAMQQAMQQSAIAEQAKKVEAFAADPAHKYFEEAGDDILRLLKTGAAPDLASAYEMAIWANPSTRQKLLAEQVKAAIPGTKPKPTNLESSGEGTLSKKKTQTIDDTIAGIVAKYTTGAL